MLDAHEYHDAGVGAGTVERRHLPSPAVVIVVDLAGTISAPGTPARLGGFIAGPHTTPLSTVHADEQHCIEVRLPPAAAAGLLDVTGQDLMGRVIPLVDIDAALVDQVMSASTADERISTVERWAQGGCAPDELVDRAWALLHAHHGAVRVATLADALGVDRRLLLRRFHRGTGLTVKAAARLMRFHRTVATLDRAGASLADISVDTGYADQPHLTRDFVEYAGMTPGRYRREPLRELRLRSGCSTVEAAGDGQIFKTADT